MIKRLTSTCILGLLLTILSINTFAAATLANNYSSSWTPVRFDIVEGLYWPKTNNAYGLILGLPYAYVNQGTDGRSDGLILSAVTECDNANGIQASILNINTYNSSGLQLAGMNVARWFEGVQFGGYNEFEESDGLQVGLCNVSSVNSNSVMLSLINYSDYNSKGFQIAISNSAYDFDGIQLGAFNINCNNGSKGIQIGLLNYMKNGFLPFFPFFNFSL
ncbi:MAG: hypothetical protein GY756_02225 [bacterium]|nr:hypothetical protein [bacterium]